MIPLMPILLMSIWSIGAIFVIFDVSMIIINNHLNEARGSFVNHASIFFKRKLKLLKTFKFAAYVIKDHDERRFMKIYLRNINFKFVSLWLKSPEKN